MSTNKEPHSNTYTTAIGKTHVFTLDPLSVCLCMPINIPITIFTCDQQQQANDRLHVRLSIHSHFQCNEETFRKQCLTLHVFSCIYKHMYTYVYTYNHTNMFLGCRSRGPRTWHGLGSPKPLRNRS